MALAMPRKAEPKAVKSKAPQGADLLAVLEDRFAKNKGRHAGVAWKQVRVRLQGNAGKLRALQEMERTGGEPDVVGLDAKTGEVLFFDCSAQSPAGRRSLCYDAEALAARKQNKPKGSAKAVAAAMGVELLTEEQYRRLQGLGDFDTTTSSWVETPAAVRKRGGALFCDRRYDHVFVYHNGADSYYAARGFRGALRV